MNTLVNTTLLIVVKWIEFEVSIILGATRIRIYGTYLDLDISCQNECFNNDSKCVLSPILMMP